MVSLLVGCSTSPHHVDESVGRFRIVTLDDSPGTNRLFTVFKKLLEKDKALEAYDFRKIFLLQENGRPHSPPKESYIVLTSLSRTTNYTNNPSELLATIIHEELHEFVDQNQKKRDLALEKIKRIWPEDKIPTDRSQVADDLKSTYEHIIICYLELYGLKKTIGDEGAEKVIGKRKMYPWIYQTVLKNQSVLNDILLETDLLYPKMASRLPH